MYVPVMRATNLTSEPEVAVPIRCAKLKCELNITSEGRALRSQLRSVYEETSVQSTERKVMLGNCRATWRILGSMSDVKGHFGTWNCSKGWLAPE